MTSPIDWSELNPQAHEFQPESAKPQLIGLLKSVGTDGEDWRWRANATEQVDAFFVAKFGSWTFGWRWSNSEGDPGGGPVSSWCCNSHSMLPEGNPEREADATATKAIEGLKEWRSFLEFIDEVAQSTSLSGDLHANTLALNDACDRVFSEVVRRSTCADAWYGFATFSLRALLEALGFGSDEADTNVQRFLGGQFQSWVEPPTSESKEILHNLTAEMLRKD